jgi:hypothetical protein
VCTVVGLYCRMFGLCWCISQDNFILVCCVWFTLYRNVCIYFIYSTHILCRSVCPLVIYSLIHFIDMCRMQRFLAVLRSFFHFSLLYIFYCQSSPPTILPSSLSSSCHLFLGLPLNHVVSKIMYNIVKGFLFFSILFTCPNQRNVFYLIFSVMVVFFNNCMNLFIVNILQFSFSLSYEYTGSRILLYTFLSKMFNCFLSLLVRMFMFYLLLCSLISTLVFWICVYFLKIL